MSKLPGKLPGPGRTSAFERNKRRGDDKDQEMTCPNFTAGPERRWRFGDRFDRRPGRQRGAAS